MRAGRKERQWLIRQKGLPSPGHKAIRVRFRLSVRFCCHREALGKHAFLLHGQLVLFRDSGAGGGQQQGGRGRGGWQGGPAGVADWAGRVGSGVTQSAGELVKVGVHTGGHPGQLLRGLRAPRAQLLPHLLAHLARELVQASLHPRAERIQRGLGGRVRRGRGGRGCFPRL